ncbi:MAG: hypothetical protein QE290_12830 [Acidovorax sp.]|uniref:hypothetical protein n=1 Tax=Acidovorax sp. TaxID=1872122 RepID=UPI0026134C34|nr:hypothetical protein [Acidovorax sp.]MDH4464903.1 hypothetical protein [Acidovorax sp.]
MVSVQPPDKPPAHPNNEVRAPAGWRRQMQDNLQMPSWNTFMKPASVPKHDYLKHFSKDDAKTRITALALVMAPSIVWAVVGALVIVVTLIARIFG